MGAAISGTAHFLCDKAGHHTRLRKDFTVAIGAGGVVLDRSGDRDLTDDCGLEGEVDVLV